MKVNVVVVTSSGRIHSSALVEGTKLEVLKGIFKQNYSTKEGQALVETTFAKSGLNDLPFNEVVDWIKQEVEDENDLIIDRLGLYEMIGDDVEQFFNEVLELLDGEVGTSIEEVAETQTTFITKVE